MSTAFRTRTTTSWYVYVYVCERERLRRLLTTTLAVIAQRKQSSDTPSLAEVGSLQLEFKFLARLTGNQQYFDQVERVMDSVRECAVNVLLHS